MSTGFMASALSMLASAGLVVLLANSVSADTGVLEKANRPLANKISAAPGSYSSLATDNQEMWIEKKADGVRIAALVDKIAGRDLLSTADQSIFQLELDVNGVKTGVRSDLGWNKVRITSSANGLRMSLSGRKDPGIESLNALITAKVSSDKKSILWRLKVDGVQQNASVRMVRFPQVVISIKPGYWNLFFPISAGIVRSGEQLKNIDLSGEYPNGWATMQYMSVYDRQSGFCFSCQDPYGSYRIIRANGTPDDSMRLYTEQFAPNMTVPGNGYESDYDTAWQTYQGDWYDAAMIYKKWASKEAKWYKRKGQPRTPDTNNDIVELSAWAQGGGGPADCVDAVLKFKEYMGVPTGFHWYSWHAIPFDNDYPHYFPTRPGVADGVKKLKEAGVFVMPYINGRLWDSRDRGTEDWEFTSVAVPGTTKDEKGVPYLESYGSKESDGSDVKLSIMCPTTKVWQDRMSDIVLRLMNEVGVNGVYIDQIAAAAPRVCMDKSHGHPLGGGHWWTEGYWKLVQNIRNRMPKGHFLTTECNAEPYIRWFDEYLTWHWQEDNMVAAFPAVYGGTIGMFGRSYSGDAAAVKAKVAQQLVFGEQIGWCDPGIINDKAKGEYMRSAIRLRHIFTKVISRGEMLRPLELNCNQPPITSDWQWYSVRLVTTDPVLTGTWKQGNRVVILFANVSDKPVSSKFRINAREYGIPEKLRVGVYDSEGKTGEIGLDLSGQQNIELDPNQIMAWECSI